MVLCFSIFGRDFIMSHALFSMRSSHVFLSTPPPKKKNTFSDHAGRGSTVRPVWGWAPACPSSQVAKEHKYPPPHPHFQRSWSCLTDKPWVISLVVSKTSWVLSLCFYDPSGFQMELVTMGVGQRMQNFDLQVAGKPSRCTVAPLHARDAVATYAAILSWTLFETRCDFCIFNLLQEDLFDEYCWTWPSSTSEVRFSKWHWENTSGIYK